MPARGNNSQSRDHQTLAELLFYMPNAKMRKELEEFRVTYEAQHGPTDLTKRYTSTWDHDEQEWLANHYPKKYFDGWPPFVQAFYREVLSERAQEGSLDDESPWLIKLFMSGQMKSDRDRHR